MARRSWGHAGGEAVLARHGQNPEDPARGGENGLGGLAGGGEGNGELLLARRHLAVELAVQRGAQASPDRRAGRDPGRHEVVAVDLERDVAEVVEPAAGRLRVAQRAGGAPRLGRRSSGRDGDLRRSRLGLQPFGQRGRIAHRRDHAVALVRGEAPVVHGGPERVGVGGDGAAREHRRPLVDAEVQARRVAHEAEEARGVVGERGVVEDPQPALPEVLVRAGRLAHVAVEVGGDRVDGEVAPQQVLVERRGLDLGQRPRACVALAAGGGEVVGMLAGVDPGGEKRLVERPPAPPSLRQQPRHRPLVILGAAALVVVLAALGAYLYVHGHEPGDVYNATVEFQNERPAKPVRTHHQAAFIWPDYGYTKNRRRYLPTSADLRPPFKTVWAMPTKDLVEFPPVMAGGRLFLLKNNGTLWAIGANNGHHMWQRKVGAQAAASPSVANGMVYAVGLKRLHRVPAGRVAAYSQRRGRVLWSRPLRSRSESSPLYANGMLYFGSEDGTVYGLNARNGHVRWTYRAPGAVKGGLALSNGILYFGDYSGHVQAVRASNGHKVWSAKTSGAKFGFESGQFYSTPAVAFGRVYLCNTDGFVYSFATTTGKLAWSKRTSNYVYASPAVADIPHYGPTVYLGSYDGTF